MPLGRMPVTGRTNACHHGMAARGKIIFKQHDSAIPVHGFVRCVFSGVHVMSTFELACVEDVIAQDIANGGSQKSVAKTYALGIRSSWPTDWVQVNAMIMARWPKGLERIKKMAWSGTCFE